MTDGFFDSYRRNLAPAYQIVHEPGPDVLYVKTAMTGVQMVNPALGVKDLVPVKALYNLRRKATGTAPQVIEVSAEMEVFDAMGIVWCEALQRAKARRLCSRAIRLPGRRCKLSRIIGPRDSGKGWINCMMLSKVNTD